MKRFVSLLSLGFFGGLAAQSAAAEPKTTNPSCQNAFAVLGWSKFDVQQAEAATKLAEARLKKGAVLEQMGDPCAAYASYKAVATLEARGVPANTLSIARDKASALEPSLRATVTFKTEPEKPEGLVVTVDGARVSGRFVTLSAGDHAVTVGAKGFQTHTESLSVCKEEREIAVQLQPEVAAGPSVAETSAATKSPTSTGKDDEDKGDDDDDDDDSPSPVAKPLTAVTPPAAMPPAAEAATAAPATTPSAAPEAPKPLVFKGTAAMRRELARWSVAENDWQKVADHWEASKKLPWNKVGWILGRRRSLEAVGSVTPGNTHHVSFNQYRVRGQDGAYAYVANCGHGETCNRIAKTFLFLYEGIGVPQVECGALPEILESPFSPEIPIPTAEEIAKRDAEWLASHAKDDDDEKSEKGDTKSDATSDDDDDDDDDD
jgi:hypothetical protein